MTTAVLVVDLDVIDKPFRLVERFAHCGGTEYDTICRLSESHARLLAREGIRWLYGEPEWEKHWHKLDLLKAEREKAAAEKRIAELKAVAACADGLFATNG